MRDKPTWRRMLLQRRETISETTRSAEERALRDAVVNWIARDRPAVVGAYVPVGPEPGSLDLLDAIVAAGCRVLLPIVVRREALDWAEYQGRESLTPAAFGLLEPAGERLGQKAVADADAMLVPALAVDHRGVRLGRGAGYYDRSLALVSSSALLIGMVRDEEFVAELPDEDHDVRVHAVVTPSRGIVSLPL